MVARLLQVVTALLFGIGMFGCSDPGSLRIAMNPWVGIETLPLAKQLGWLGDEVELIETASMSASSGLVIAGQVDAAALTMDEMLLSRERGVPLTAVLVFDVSAGADVLLARPQFLSVADLAGRRIGVERSALGWLLLSEALASAGLDVNDVETLDLTPSEQVEAWKAGKVDAVVTYGPEAAELEAICARRLFDSREMPNLIVDVLAVRRDRIRHPALPAVIAAHFHALEHLRSNRGDAIHRIADRQGLTTNEVRAALSGIVMPGLSANRDLLRDGGGLQQTAAQLSHHIMAVGLIDEPAGLEQVTDDRLVVAQARSAE